MIRHKLSLSAAALATGLISPPLQAQTDANAAITAETERVKAEAELQKQKAELAKQEAERVKALGLPSFDGKTELSTNAGALEATMLTTDALRAAAALISTRARERSKPNEKYLVLAGNEALDFGVVGSLHTQMDAIKILFERADAVPPPVKMVGNSVSGAIAAISAVAGLLRSDTTLSGLDTAAISDAVLATAVASRLGTRAILPAAAIAPEPTANVPEHRDWEQKHLIHKFNRLAEYRDLAEEAKNAIPADPKKQNPSQKAQLAALNPAIGRYDSFFAKATAPNDSGAVPIAVAARLDTMLTQDVSVLRLHVDKAGGSLINTKNLATTLGADPLRVTGGLLVRYLITDPRSGALQEADVLTCGTVLTRVRRVQESHWRDDPASGQGPARSGCKGMIANGGQLPEAARPSRLGYDLGFMR